MKKVGIVLVNYKDYAERFLEACRDSLRLQDYPASDFRVYIVDNASSQASRDYLCAIYSEAVILERADGNYAAANNFGFRQAIEDGCEYLVSANMDTEMAPSWLSALVAALEDNPEAGLAQSKILLYPTNEAEKQRPLINSLGNRCHFLGFGFTSAYRVPDREIAGYPEINGYASGCSFIIRAAVFTAIGGYDEEYYMYHDDLELSLKARFAGWKIVLAPRSVILHKYEFSRSTQMVYYMERNRYLTIFSFYSPALLIILFPPLVLSALAILIYAFIGSWGGAALKVAAYFFRPQTYRHIIASRRARRAFQKEKFSVIARGFSSRIEFSEVANPFLKYVANPLMAAFWHLVKKIA